MKKLFAASFASLLTLSAAAALAEGPMGGLGFRQGDAPIGIRQWFNDQVGVDAGVGFDTGKLEDDPDILDDFGYRELATTFWMIDVGVPVRIKSWEKVSFIGRPGFQIGASKLELKQPEPGVTPAQREATTTAWAVTGELEVELWLAEKVSVSASHGIAFASAEDDDKVATTRDPKRTAFGTVGGNFTQLGFHVYLW